MLSSRASLYVSEANVFSIFIQFELLFESELISLEIASLNKAQVLSSCFASFIWLDLFSSSLSNVAFSNLSTVFVVSNLSSTTENGIRCIVSEAETLVESIRFSSASIDSLLVCSICLDLFLTYSLCDRLKQHFRLGWYLDCRKLSKFTFCFLGESTFRQYSILLRLLISSNLFALNCFRPPSDSPLAVDWYWYLPSLMTSVRGLRFSDLKRFNRFDLYFSFKWFW